MKRYSSWILFALAVAALAAHALRLLWLLGGFEGLLDQTPLLEGDYSLHAYYAMTASRGRSLWAYDPHFMAGYPKTPLFPTSSVYYELAARFMPALTPWAKLKLAVLTAALAPAILVPLAAGLVSGRLAGAAAMLLVVLTYWLDQPEEFLRVGLASWLMGTAIVAVAVAAFVASLTRHPSYGVLLLAAAALAVWIHLVSVVPLVVALAGSLVFGAWKGRFWNWLIVGLSLGLAAVAVAPLAVAAWASLEHVDRSGVFYVSDAPWLDLLEVLLLSARPTWLVLVLALAAPWLAGPEDLSVRWLLGAGLAVLVLGYLGSAIPGLDDLQPVRYRSVGWWILTLPAAASLVSLVRHGTSTSQVPRAGRIVALVVLLRAALPGVDALVRPAELMVRPYDAAHQQLVRWIQEETTKEARILFEDISGLDSLHRQHPEAYAGPGIVVLRRRVSPLLPVLTDRFFVGGLYYPAYLKHAYVKFGNGRLFGRLVWDGRRVAVSRGELVAWIRQYNLGWAVVWSPPALRLLETYPDVAERVGRAGPYHLFRFPGSKSYCLRGSARVQLDWSKIVLEPDGLEGGRSVLLSLHWDPGWRVAEGEAEIFAERVGEDPVPFLGVRLRGKGERVVLLWEL